MADTIPLSQVFASVHVTPGQASKVLYALASDLGDSDPELRTAFLSAADEVTAPPPDPPSTTRVGTKSPSA